MPGNIPQQIKRLDLDRENTFTATFVFPASYPAQTPTGKVERNDRLLTGVTPTLSAWSDATIEGQPKRIFSFTYTPEILNDMKGLCVHTFMLDGQAFAAGQINSRTGYGETDPVNYNVMLDGDSYLIVEVPGLDIVAGLAAQVAADRVQTGLDRIATGEDRTATAGSASAALTSEQNAANHETGANDAKVAAEEARDEVAESRRFSVATRAAIDVHLESGKPRLFEVAIDETLGDSALVPYRWNGSILFMYDIYPALTQPTI